MNNNYRWIAIVAAVALATAVGWIAYNAGVSQGIEQSGRIITAPGGAPHAYPYHWHRPWGFGFFFVPLFFILFWVLIFRGLFGHGGWHRGRCGQRLDEWHREAHERMWNDPSSGGAAAR